MSLPTLMREALKEVPESLKSVVGEGGGAPSQDEMEVLVNQAFLLKVNRTRKVAVGVCTGKNSYKSFVGFLTFLSHDHPAEPEEGRSAEEVWRVSGAVRRDAGEGDAAVRPRRQRARRGLPRNANRTR